jgi:hypothetical protein
MFKMHLKSVVSALAVSASVASGYSLIDTYDYTNWMSKFSVQNVSLDLFARIVHH